VHTIRLRSISILSFGLRLDFPSGFFPSCFPTRKLYAFLLSTIRASCHAYLILFGSTILNILGEEYKLRTFLFSNTLSLRMFLIVRDQVSHPHRITGKIIIILYILIFFREERRIQKVLDWMIVSITRIQSPVNFLLNQFWFMFELCHIFKRSVCYLYVIISTCILVPRQQHMYSFSLGYLWYLPVDLHHQHFFNSLLAIRITLDPIS
jgi:hypothetical protein